jgi:hypothetical protein
MALCSNSYARATSQFSSQPATTELTNLLEAASDLIEDYCDRVFASTAYTEKQDGNGLHFIYAKNPPSVSFTSIIITDPDESSPLSSSQTQTRAQRLSLRLSSAHAQTTAGSRLSSSRITPQATMYSRRGLLTYKSTTLGAMRLSLTRYRGRV